MPSNMPPAEDIVVLAFDPDGPFELVEMDGGDLPAGGLFAIELRPRELNVLAAHQRLDAAQQALADLPPDATRARRAIAEASVRRAAAIVEGEARLEEARVAFATGPDDWELAYPATSDPRR